ncbi:MAG TPA: baseplate J/gp47 family protein [Candidatus Methanoperedens sp.]|nr:baseplate J/gp47 family protein [Candidatus Methanoperedens sp.]HLB69443.1 baseplate J/gp47 family protein [Candidatus Methanoperedens sp.]
MITFVRKSYNEITEAILSQVTKGIVNEKHEYTINKVKYKLAQPNALEIVKIDGTAKGAPAVFQKNTDYRLGNNMVEWLPGGEKPDDHTPFFVNYKLNAPQLITDINPGSVIRTIVESAALEIDFLFAQMEQVYNSGFIDTATGKSLDLVVSLLGIVRKSAESATGEVTFGRNNEPGEIEILHERHVESGADRYLLKNPLAKSIKNVDGIYGGNITPFLQVQDYNFSDGAIVWVEGGKRPDAGSEFSVDYPAYEQIIIPKGVEVSTESRRPENLKKFRTTIDATLIRNSEGRWETEVPVMAMSPGKEGNVYAYAISLMPKPVIGIEYVKNKNDIMNGTDPENDSELRERAKHALEKAGKASVDSLKSAVQGIKGVVGEVKVVDQPEGVPGVVQIIASGGDEKEIETVIEETRSAGIKVEFKRPTIIPLEIKLTIVVVEGMDEIEVKNEVERMIREYIDSLSIDEDVVRSQIIKAALSVQGVKDVHDVTINGKKENIEVRSDEKAELRSPPEIYTGE